MNRETKKFNRPKPFNSITCLANQVLLPDNQNLYPGETVSAEGTLITSPLRSQTVKTYLEGLYPEVVSSDYVSVFHYLPGEQQFVSYVSGKYDFEFMLPWPAASPATAITFYPALSYDQQVSTVTHEFMHKIGASDKYSDDAISACKIDPATGLQYSGYDIMCHRIADPTGGFNRPNITEQVATDPTAKEVLWK
jgi:hypothetical protein